MPQINLTGYDTATVQSFKGAYKNVYYKMTYAKKISRPEKIEIMTEGNHTINSYIITTVGRTFGF